jgi:diguanylate cyclase (GGDEF)-like protein
MQSSGMVVAPERSAADPAHSEAVVAGYALLEQSQSGPLGTGATDLLDRAAAHGWHDVALLVHYSVYAHALLNGDDPVELIDRMEVEAEGADDDALRALVVATRGELPERDRGEGPAAPDAALARAVALLDDGRGSAVHRPVAYIACGLGYGHRNLWELEEEMYERADEALAVPLPPGLEGTRLFNRRVVALNRSEAHAAWTCALAEAGLTDDARRRAADRRGLPADVVQDLPPQWLRDNTSVHYLLAAIAGDPEPAPYEEVCRGVETSSWPGYLGCARLGGAVRALAAGQDEVAAALVEQSLTRLSDDYLPTIRMMALGVAARLGATPASTRYVDELTALRWSARIKLLGAARARLEAERIKLENARLAERAYLDELTGAANRHAYARHLTRLRRNPEDHHLAVLMVDLDHFKRVNDDLGHAVGDDVLRRVVAVLAEHCRPSDLVVRLGGDEFVLLLDTVHGHDARRRGDQIVDAVHALGWEDLSPGLRVTVSAGLAVGPSPAVDDLLRDADSRLYRAKALGRGQLCTDI